MNSFGTIERVSHREPLTAFRIWTVFQKSYKAEAELLGVDSFPPLERSVESIRDSDNAFWCFSAGGQPGGVVEVNDQVTCLDICSLAVSPEFFRQGIATALMSHVLSLAAHKDVVVQTARLNVPAISLYRGFNFTETETLESRDGIVLVSFIKKRTLAQL